MQFEIKSGVHCQRRCGRDVQNLEWNTVPSVVFEEIIQLARLYSAVCTRWTEFAKMDVVLRMSEVEIFFISEAGTISLRSHLHDTTIRSLGFMPQRDTDVMD